MALLAFTSNAFAPILYAEENTARQQSCEFVSTLIEEGSVAGADTFAEMFSWGDVETRSIRSSIRVLEDFEFDLGNIYLITDFDGLAERHLAVLSTKNSGTMFLLVDFERVRGELVATHFKFNDKYRNLIGEVGAFSFEPKKIAC